MRLNNEYLVDLLQRIRDLDDDDELIIELFDIADDLITELLTYRNDTYGRNVDTSGMTMVSYTEQLKTEHA